MKIIDAHVHVMGEWAEPKGVARLLAAADRFDIEWLAVSLGRDLVAQPTREETRRDNDHVLGLMKRHSDRIAGYCYLNPRLGAWCLDELQRCLEGGMRGIKLWIACLCDDPTVYPIVERAIALNLPILVHTWKKTTGNQPGESEPRHLVNLAVRYPEARLIMAHAGGCWERGIKAVRELPNVWIDTAGGSPTQGFVEMAIRELGPGRIVFGSDACGRSFASQLSKVDCVKLPERARRRILYDNARLLLGL